MFGLQLILVEPNKMLQDRSFGFEFDPTGTECRIALSNDADMPEYSSSLQSKYGNRPIVYELLHG